MFMKISLSLILLVCFAIPVSAAPVLVVGQLVDEKDQPVSGVRVLISDLTSEPPFDDVPQNLLPQNVVLSDADGYFAFQFDLDPNNYLLASVTIRALNPGHPSVTVMPAVNVESPTLLDISKIMLGEIVPTDVPSALLTVFSNLLGVSVTTAKLSTEFVRQGTAVKITIPEPLTVSLMLGGLGVLMAGSGRRKTRA